VIYCTKVYEKRLIHLLLPRNIKGRIMFDAFVVTH
jgi:hypothetical protein